VTKKELGKSRRKGKSNKTEENVQAQGKETQPKRVIRATLAAQRRRGPATEEQVLGSSPLGQVQFPPPDGSPPDQVDFPPPDRSLLDQVDFPLPDRSTLDQVCLPPPVKTAYAEAFDTDLVIGPGSQPKLRLSTKQSPSSTKKTESDANKPEPSDKDSNARSKSPVKSMNDLAFADKRISMTPIENSTQLPKDVRKMYDTLMVLGTTGQESCRQSSR